ncbi:hypothetical protein [Sphingomonas sp. BK580]|uniref:hypothetical protein n=1 Tax=Sphingomonas sp. BK580 TaxID=2586972 RepID=UPI00161AF36A|nr:hypothetical protein [Sphingomonas sp. BK580]MBB3695050.1 hypothetical protein [Sphingomonas sp. BK580]
MPRRSEPGYRPPTDEVEGLAGCLLFLLFFAGETLIGGVAAFGAYRLVRVEQLDPGHAVACAAAFMGGLAALWYADRHCLRLTGFSAATVGLELLAWWP